MHVGNWSWISDSISSWTWPGYEHKPVKVEVFTRAEEAELYINGKLAGREKTGTMMLVARIVDGFSDVVFGVLIEKTHFKMGKIRP